MPLKEGDTILNGKYHIIRSLGEGAFGHVYLADDTVMGQRVAIKELRRAELTAEQYQEHLTRFRREALIGRSLLQQTHIVKVYTLECSGDDYYLVMEYVDGESLQKRIQREGRLSMADAVNIAVQLCDALSEVHCHPLGIVHRDIKPSNILLTRDGTAKLADFGLAQLAQQSSRSLGAGSAHPGAPLYKSPEAETTTRYLDPASDIYSLGLVLAEMLVGKPYKPLVRRNQMVKKLRPDVPTGLDRTIARAVAEDLEERYCEAADVKADLLQQQRKLAKPAATPVPLPAVGEKPLAKKGEGPSVWTRLLHGLARRRRLLVGLGATLGITILVAICWAAVGGMVPSDGQTTPTREVRASNTPTVTLSPTNTPEPTYTPTPTAKPTTTLPPPTVTQHSPIPTAAPSPMPTATPRLPTPTARTSTATPKATGSPAPAGYKYPAPVLLSPDNWAKFGTKDEVVFSVEELPLMPDEYYKVDFYALSQERSANKFWCFSLFLKSPRFVKLADSNNFDLGGWLYDNMPYEWQVLVVRLSQGQVVAELSPVGVRSFNFRDLP